MLFLDYSSAFNTIVPATLVAKLQTLGLNRSLCSWFLDFLTGRSQVVRMGNNTSSALILNTGAPQGCVLSPLLYSLYTHDCRATHSSNVIVKFADDTKVIGLITDNDETAYREEVSTLTKWCQENHLSLNIDKTKELVVDFRRPSREHTPIAIDKTPVEQVNSYKFLCVHVPEDLTWLSQSSSDRDHVTALTAASVDLKMNNFSFLVSVSALNLSWLYRQLDVPCCSVHSAQLWILTKASVQLYTCGSDGRIIIECSMKWLCHTSTFLL